MNTLQPPHSSSRRAALLEQLIVALTSAEADGTIPLPIRTRAPDDPTIALLDAWATVGDVLGFYLDRIADEGYLTTAIQPGSILALASLVGYQPVPGLAAQTYLAYALAPDPADGAVQFSPGLLFQSVPGPGQQPQAFESAAALVARPSWNLLSPKSTQPLPASPTSLVVDSTSTGLSPNDVILLDVADSGGTPTVDYVASATVDYTAQVTYVTLQGSSPAPTSPSQPTDATAAIDGLLSKGLGKPTNPVPGSANQLPQTAQSVFSPGSDTVPRLISTLQPAVAPVLYAAFGSTALGSPAVTGASGLQVKAAPFGATAPPQPVFNAKGQPAGTRDWPIGDVFTLQLSVTAASYGTVLELSGVPGVDVPGEESTTTPVPVNVQWSTAAFSSQATMDASSLPATASPAPTGFGAVGLQSQAGTVILSYDGYPVPDTPSTLTPPSTAPLRVVVSIDPSTAVVTLEFTDPVRATHPSLGTLIWAPQLGTSFSGQVADTLVTITWTTSALDGGTLTISFATPLPLPAAEQTVLNLDGTYPGITPGSYVLIDSPDPADPNSTVGYPVHTTVVSVATVAASGYGISAQITQLTLADPWIDGTARLQTALRPLSVHAQPAALPLLPAPVTADISGSSIDLAGLVAGMEPGRLIAVTGTRTDLPAGATIQTGEIAMVASVTTGGEGGDMTYSTLNLAYPLAYSYQRSTVQVYGNVVPAHQGATITQVLGSGQPANAPQSFTLTSGPLLADPAPTGSGFASSLTVTVDGVGYAQVSRFDGSTPTRSFLVGTNASGQTTITFPAPLPPGAGNIIASYRAGPATRETSRRARSPSCSATRRASARSPIRCRRPAAAGVTTRNRSVPRPRSALAGSAGSSPSPTTPGWRARSPGWARPAPTSPRARASWSPSPGPIRCNWTRTTACAWASPPPSPRWPTPLCRPRWCRPACT